MSPLPVPVPTEFWALFGFCAMVLVRVCGEDSRHNSLGQFIFSFDFVFALGMSFGITCTLWISGQWFLWIGRTFIRGMS